MALNWDLVVEDGEEGVGAFDVFAIVGTDANALAQVAQFICIGGIPGSQEGGVSLKLSPFNKVACAFI